MTLLRVGIRNYYPQCQTIGTEWCFGLIFRWYISDVLYLWSGKHHLSVEWKWIPWSEWIQTVIPDGPQVQKKSPSYQRSIIIHYQMKIRHFSVSYSKGFDWTSWTECLTDRSLIEQCRFIGDKSKRIRVKLVSAAAPHSRTFYTEEFTHQKSGE